MKRKIIEGLTVIVAIVSIVVFTGCLDGDQVNTYDKFGFSFDYPADMIIEKRGILSDANEESGSITLTSTTKPVRTIVITWGLIKEGEDTSETYLEETSDSYLASQDVICQAKREKRSHLGHTVIEQRYVVYHKLKFDGIDEEFITVRSEGIWYCDKSKKGFIVGASRLSEDAGIKGDNRYNIEMLPLEKDPVYNDYREIIDSFRCHS